jgi:hypothetical protein
MKTNPADTVKDTMWRFLMMGGLIQMTTQKTAGQRRGTKKDIDWGALDMVLMRIVIEATALVLSGDLEEKEEENNGYGTKDEA